MSAPRQLALAWVRRHRGRALLSAGAVALAASLVVFTVGAYRALGERSSGFAREVLGPFDLVVSPSYAMDPRIPVGLDADLAADPAIDQVWRVGVVWGDIEDVNDTTYYDSWRAGFIGCDQAEPPVALRAGEWIDPAGEALDGVVSGGLAARWQVAVGDALPVHTRGGESSVRVIGITDEQLPHAEISGVWVAPGTAQRLAGQDPPADRLFVSLVERDQAPAVEAAWRERTADQRVRWRGVADLALELGADKAMKRLPSMGAGGAAIALIAAAFIIFAAASAGADERVRQLAVLRAVGATRGQVARSIVGEGLVLAVLGTVAGLVLGALWLALVGAFKADLFGGPVAPDPLGMLGGVVAALVAAAAAAALPAWRASRRPPVEAIAGATPPPPRSRRWPAILGLVLWVAAVALTAGSTASAGPGALAGTALALLLVIVAGLLLAGPALVLARLVLGPVLGRTLGLPAELVRQGAAAGGGRVVGTVLTLATCLGLSVTMNTWGRTMVIPFLPSPQLPDVVVSIMPSGLPPAVADKVAAAPGLAPGRVLPMAVEQTLLAPPLMDRAGGASAAWVQLIGVEPEAALLGDDPLLPLELEAGTPGDAATALAEPMSCLLPPSFAEQLGLGVGDDLVLMALGDSRERSRLRIVGLASLPGWQWVTKLSRMRTLGGKSLAPVLLSRETAAAVGITRIRHWYADVDDGYDRGALRTELQTLADANLGDYVDPHFGGASAGTASVKVVATKDVGDRLQAQSDKVIWVLGAIPLAALAVALLGVAGAIAAGVRARSWEFGVLRSLGLEARGAARLVVVEALLLSAAAALLSVGCGIVAAWAAIAVSLQAFKAGGTMPPLIIPWLDIAIAIAITAAVAALAAWIPARQLGRREPLALLQAGRGSG